MDGCPEPYVFPDISLRSDPQGKHNSQGSLFNFRDDYALRWGVLPRDFKPGDTARWFDTGIAGSLWHTVNGWEETDAAGRSTIVIDAAAMQEVARLPLPQRVPFGVHACWLDTSRLDVMAAQG